MKIKSAQTTLYRTLASAGLVASLFVAPLAHADDAADISKLAKAGKVAEALAKTNDYLVKHPNDPQMRFMKGVLLTEQNKSEEAIAVFTKLTEDYKDLPEPYNNLAVLYAANGQYDKARVALEKAIRTNPSYQTAYENLGDVYGKMASQAYDKALALGSNTAPPKSKLTLLRNFSTSTGGKIVGQEMVAQAPASAPAPTPTPARPAASAQPPLISQLPPQDQAKANAPQRIPALSVSPPAPAAKVAAAPTPAPVAAKPVPTPVQAPVVAKAAPAPAPAPVPAPAPAPAPAPVKIAAAPAPVPAPVKVAVAPAPVPAPVKVAAAPTPAPAPAKVEPPKPAKPEPVKPDTSERDAVLAQVHGWAKAWSSQDVDSYLGYYSQQFEPPKGMTHKAWAEERRARIEGKGRIRVEVGAPEVVVNGNTARVTFRQTYESDRLTARSRKTLVLVKNSGKWQIKQESSGS